MALFIYRARYVETTDLHYIPLVYLNDVLFDFNNLFSTNHSHYMPTQNNQNFFTGLPDEVKLNILSFLELSPGELAKLSKVSEPFNRIAHDNSLWKAHLPQEDQEKAKQEITNYKAYYVKHYNELKAIIDDPDLSSAEKILYLEYHVKETASLLDANIIFKYPIFRKQFLEEPFPYFFVGFGCIRKEFALLILEDREFKRCFLNESLSWLADIACSDPEVAFSILNDAEYRKKFKTDTFGSQAIHKIAGTFELQASLTREPTTDFLADYESITMSLIDELVAALDRKLKATTSVATPTIR